MKNLIILIILSITLSACSVIDALVEGAPLKQDTQITNEVVSIEFRRDDDSTNIYSSNDQTNYALYQTIPGRLIGHSFFDQEYKGILKNEGFVVIEKTASSPSSWGNRSLWYVGSAPQTFEQYMDIPFDISDCKLFNHTDFLNMYCWDSNYTSPFMYQVDKHEKTMQSVLDRWGYVEDTNYSYEARLLSTRSDEQSETIAIYKVLKTDTNVKEILDIYVYAGNDYQKVTIDPSDLSAIKTMDLSLAQQVSAGAEELVFISCYDSNGDFANMLVINISTPTDSRLNRYENVNAWYIGVIGNKVILASDTYIQTYSTASGFQDTSIPTGVSTNQIYGNVVITTDGASFKMCSLNGVCNDFSNSSFHQGTSKKIYFVDNAPSEPDRVIRSVNTATGVVAVETALTALIRAQGMSMNQVSIISQNGDYLIVEESNYRYFVFDKDATTIKADFYDVCTGNLSDIIQGNKYRKSHFKGWNLLQNLFNCS